MQITPIQNTNFNGYTSKDIKKLSSYTNKHKQGSLYDLYKKFDSELINSFSMSGKITIPKATQNWKLGPNSKNKFHNYFSMAYKKGSGFNKTGNQ